MFTNLRLHAGSPPANPAVLLFGPVSGTRLANASTLQVPAPRPAGIAVTVGAADDSIGMNPIGPRYPPTPATWQAVAGAVGGFQACTFIV